MSSNSCGGDSSFEKNRQNRAPTANPSSIAEFLARLFYFFRAFERSCFRDGFSLFSPGTRNPQEDHENTKGRKHEKTPPSRTLLRYLPYLLFKILLLVPAVFTRHEIWYQSSIKFDRLRSSSTGFPAVRLVSRLRTNDFRVFEMGFHRSHPESKITRRITKTRTADGSPAASTGRPALN